MDFIYSIAEFTRADSLGSILIRGLIWLAAVLLLATGIDSGKNYSRIKADAGWFFLFIFSIGIMSFIIFGFAPTF